MDKMREEFEGWWNSEGQKITTGTKGDALISWQAARAKPAEHDTMQLAEMVLSDCGISTVISDRLQRRVAERIQRHVDGLLAAQPAEHEPLAAIREAMELREWKAALRGLCVGREPLTAAECAENVRHRLRTAVAAQPAGEAVQYGKTPGCKQCDEAEACGLTFCPECDAQFCDDHNDGKQVQWVDCPVCGEHDMQKTTDADGNALIQCSNHACLSNGGTAYTAPPAQVPDAVALDAKRFRFVAVNGWPRGERQIHPTVEAPFFFYGDDASVAERYNSPVEAIDAAMLAAAPQPKGGE